MSDFMAYTSPSINIHDARKQRAQLRLEATAILDGAVDAKRELNAEENKKFIAVTAKIEDLGRQLDEHVAGGHSVIEEPVASIASPVRSSLRSSLRSQLTDVYARADGETRAQIDALAGALRGNIRASADLRPSSDGGVIIPSAVQEVMERNYAAFAPVVSAARLFPTENGEPTTFPVLSDSETAVQLDAAAATGADATVSGDTPPTTLTGPQLKAWKVSSKPVFVPRELSTDSPIDIIQEVIGALLARIIRFENLKYTKGVGTTEAEGFLTDATAMHAGSGAVLDLDMALDLAYNVSALYRPNGKFMASDTSVKYLRKLKTGLSGDKRALWNAFEEGNATAGTPARLHGYDLVINNDMDSVSADGTFAGATPLAFGDFSKFVVRQAENNSPYAYIYPVPAKDGRAAILFRRSDSKLLVPTAISKLVV